MGERLVRRPRRISLRRPLPPPPKEKPVPHIPKKPVLASTGTRVDRLCAICLGRLEPGVAITFCKCGKFFHLDCISEVKICPICQYEMEFSHIIVDESQVSNNSQSITSTATLPEYGTSEEQNTEETAELHEEEYYEEVFQCPLCLAYVDESAAECQCGAQFDTEEEIYTCPDCGAEIEQDAIECPKCGISFES